MELHQRRKGIIYNDIQSIAEFESDYSTSPGRLQQLNAYLDGGWILLEIQPRSQDERQFTVYILGNTKSGATEPSFDSTSRRWTLATP